MNRKPENIMKLWILNFLKFIINKITPNIHKAKYIYNAILGTNGFIEVGFIAKGDWNSSIRFLKTLEDCILVNR